MKEAASLKELGSFQGVSSSTHFTKSAAIKLKDQLISVTLTRQLANAAF